MKTPLEQHRDHFETIASIFHAGVEQHLAQAVELSLPRTWGVDKDDPLTTPTNALLTTFGAPFSDAIVLLTSLDEAVISPIALAGIEAVREHFNTVAEDHIGLDIAPTATFATIEDVEEQCEAFYREPYVRISLPLGDLFVIVGGKLLAALDSFAPTAKDEEQEPAAEQTDTDTAADETTKLPSMDEFASELAEQQASEDAEHAARIGAAAEAAERANAERDVRQTTVAANLPGAPTDIATTHQWNRLLADVTVTVTAEIGRTNVPLGDLSQFVSSHILTLDQLIDEPVVVYVNGTRYATARLVIIDDEYGIEILAVTGAGDLTQLLAA